MMVKVGEPERLVPVFLMERAGMEFGTGWYLRRARQTEGSGRHDRAGRQHGLTHGDPAKRRAFLEPGARRRAAPQRLALGVAQRPFLRLEIRVDREVIAGKDLDAVAVRVAHIE